MIRASYFTVLFLVAAALSPVGTQEAVAQQDGAAPDDVLADWNIGGQNTIRFENYRAFGDKTQSPYAFVGPQFYDNIFVNFDRRFSPYESVRGNFSGVYNDSDYRSNETGFILERGSVSWEKGDAGVPLRAEVGDFYAFQSPRTIQRSLKGGEIELQPQWGGADQLNSIQLFAGRQASTYRQIDEDRNFDGALGASWLTRQGNAGDFNLSLIHNLQADGPASTLSDRKQTLTSLAWNKELAVSGQDLSLEAELARFQGDYLDGSAVAEDRTDTGLFSEISGRSTDLPLTYRAVFERYGKDYRPTGAAITPNHRGIEGHASWIFPSGLRLSGRTQHFRDSLESPNPSDTHVNGVALSGALLPSLGLAGTLDAYRQRSEDSAGTLDTLSHAVTASLAAPLTENDTAHVGLFFNDANNRLTDAGTITRQLTFGLDHVFSWHDLRGIVTPGIAVRSISGSRRSNAVNPTLTLALANDRHEFRFSHNVLFQDARFAGGTDSTVHQTSAGYALTWGANRLSIDGDYFRRAPSPGSNTEAYRVGLSWTVSFNKPATAPAATPAVAPAAVAAGVAAPPSLAELAPGMRLADAMTLLGRSRIANPLRRGDILVYDTRLLTGIDLPQRLGLVYKGARLVRSALAISFEDLGNGPAMSADFEKVRAILLRRYGSPAITIENGAFDGNVAAGLIAGSFRRLIEWHTPNGKLRFGIPRRLDGQVRMEIVHAADLPPPDRNDWSTTLLR